MERSKTTEAIDRHAYRLLVGIALFTLALGTVVYHLVERLSWLDAYYFSVVTLSTIGYGDITPHTDFGKLFTTFYIFVGVGIITTFITATVRRRGAKAQSRREQRAVKRDES